MVTPLEPTRALRDVPLRLSSPTERLASEAEDAVATSPLRPPTPWSVAADTGVAIGRGSQQAAAATAGFFGRVGKKIAGSF